MSKIFGQDMMLFLDDKSIAFATNHTLTIDGETQETSNKDEGSGWASQEVSKLSWSVTSDNLYSTDGEGNSYEDLYDIMIAKTPVDAVFALKAENAVDVPTGGWTPATGYKGKIVITNLTLNAPNGEYATFTMSAQGVGALQKKTT